MNGLITEGIPLGIPVQILTSGLSAGEAPPPPPDVNPTGGLLYIGVSKLLVNNEDGIFESPIFALPATMTRLSIQMSGTVLGETVDLSNDGITFIPTLIFAAPGIQYLRTGAKFLRVTINEGTGVSVVALARRETF